MFEYHFLMYKYTLFLGVRVSKIGTGTGIGIES